MSATTSVTLNAPLPSVPAVSKCPCKGVKSTTIVTNKEPEIPGIFQGILYSGFAVVNSVATIASGAKLYTAYAQGQLSSVTYKVGVLAKHFLTSSLGLVASASRLAKWAHDSQRIALGSYAPICSPLYLGCYLLIGSIHTLFFSHRAYLESTEMQSSPTQGEREWHQDLFYADLVVLIGNVAGVAWAILELSKPYTEISSVIPSVALGVSVGLSIMGRVYQSSLGLDGDGIPIPVGTTPA